MNSLIQIALLAAAPNLEEPADLKSCARAVGATETAARLTDLPQTVREQLIQRVQAVGGRLAESGTKLIETDAPSGAELQYANERFEGGMFVRNKWFVQIRQGQFAGVLTYTYFRQPNGDFQYQPVHSFRGPSCASIQAALAGVVAVPGL